MKRLMAGLLFALLAMSLSLPMPIQAAPVPEEGSPDTHQTDISIYATVRVPRLNVRRIPDREGSILGMLLLDEQVPTIGRNRLSTWLEVITAFGVGWVDARYVRTSANILALPVTEDFIAPFAEVTTSPAVLVRAGPMHEYPVITRAPYGAEMDVVGLHRDDTYVEVVTTAGLGWVSTLVVDVIGDVSGVPVTDQYVTPLAQINAYRLRVRTEPDLDSTVLARVRLGQLYPIVGQDELGNWYQITGPFGTGWVSARYVLVIGYLAPPWADVTDLGFDWGE